MRLALSILALCSGIAGGCASAHRHDPVDEDVPVFETYDADCNGVTDHCRTVVPLADGLHYGIDLDCDGVPDVDCVTLRTEGAAVIGHMFDADCDGEPGGEPVFAESLGVCLGTEHVAADRKRSFRDEDCDGVAERCDEWSVDAEGRTLTRNRDEGCDGEPEVCVTTVYDAAGFGREETDMGCDGSVESFTCRRLIRDAEGRITSDANDSDCDGVPDSFCNERTYGFGVQLTETLDGDCDGIPDLCTVAEIRNEGELTIVTVGRGACGGVPETGCTVFTLDADGNRIQEHSDRDCDGPAPTERCWVMTYDSRGRETSRTFDPECTGEPNSCSTYTYQDTY